MKGIMRAEKFIKTVFAAGTVFIFACLFSINAYAADMNVTVSSGEVTQGGEITVTISMSSDRNIGTYTLALTYDGNVLEYVDNSGADGGGGGSLTLYKDIVNAKSDTRTLKFKAKAAGSTQIQVIRQGDVCDMDYNDFDLKVSAGTVTVKAPVQTSGNNNLSKLDIMAVRKDGSSGSVSLLPEFSKNETNYQLWLESNFNKLTLSAVAEDGKAKITTSGTDLAAGDNTVTVTVTAENGAAKTYKIIVHVKKEEEQTGEPSTPEETEGPTGETEEPTEEPSQDDDRQTVIFGKKGTVKDITEDVKLPEGFEITAVNWNGKEIKGAADLAKKLTLIYVEDNETKEGRLYIYREDSNTYEEFSSYTIVQRTYTMLMMDDELQYGDEKAIESRELELTAIMLGDGHIDVFKVKNVDNLYIVKAMDWDSNIGYYYYNAKDGSIMPYFDMKKDDVDHDDSVPVINNAGKNEKKDIKNIIMAVCGILCIIFAAALAVCIVKMRRRNISDEPEEDEEDEIDDYETPGDSVTAENNEVLSENVEEENSQLSDSEEEASVTEEPEQDEESGKTNAGETDDEPETETESQQTEAEETDGEPETKLESQQLETDEEAPEEETEKEDSQSSDSEEEMSVTEEPEQDEESSQTNAGEADDEPEHESESQSTETEKPEAEPQSTETEKPEAEPQEIETEKSETEPQSVEVEETDGEPKTEEHEQSSDSEDEASAAEEPEKEEKVKEMVSPQQDSDLSRKMTEQELDSAIDDILSQLFK